HSGFGEVDGLGEPIAAALFAPGASRVELVEAQPGHDGDQKGFRRFRRRVATVPAQPCLLHHVLGAAGVAEHAVSERDELVPMGLEDGEILRIIHRAIPTSSCTCFCCSTASSMKAATARNDIVPPCSGRASTCDRYARSGRSTSRGGRTTVQFSGE